MYINKNIHWECGVGRCKLLHLKWTNKVLLYSTTNYIQSNLLVKQEGRGQNTTFKRMTQLWRRKWQPTPVFLPKNPMDRGAWQAVDHGAPESDSTDHTCTALG